MNDKIKSIRDYEKELKQLKEDLFDQAAKAIKEKAESMRKAHETKIRQ